jgi:hypothetical protein
MSRRTLVVLAALAVSGFGGIGAEEAQAEGIVFTCTPGPCGVWQPVNVALKWTVDFGVPYSTQGCELSTLYTAEGRNAATCRAIDAGGNQLASATTSVLIDRTPPTMTGASGSPGPNAFGWYTAPLTVTWRGDDARPGVETSGIAACAQLSYAGPDTATGTLTGTCRDRAGNVSVPLAFGFKYDATPPALTAFTASVGDRLVRLAWSDPGFAVEIARVSDRAEDGSRVVFRGRGNGFVDTGVTNGRHYQYRITTSDDAGNAASLAVDAAPRRGLFSPAKGEHMTAPPRVTWSEIRGARYYNVQVFRGSRKILSAWPKTPAYDMKRQWRFRGTQFELNPGTYRVFVWPGFGPFAKQRYGRIVGSRTFVVRAP